MTKQELIGIFNNVQKKFDDEITEDYFLQRLKPYADSNGLIDNHKLVMFAYNESLASSKGFLFEILAEVLVDKE